MIIINYLKPELLNVEYKKYFLYSTFNNSGFLKQTYISNYYIIIFKKMDLIEKLKLEFPNYNFEFIPILQSRIYITDGDVKFSVRITDDFDDLKSRIITTARDVNALREYWQRREEYKCNNN